MNNVLTISILVASLATLSCSKQKLTNKDEMVAYINDEGNGLLKNYKKDELEIQIAHQPTDFFVLREVESARRRSGKLTKASIDSLRKDYDNYLYFVLRIKSFDGNPLFTGTSDYAQFSEQLNKAAFDNQSILTIEVEGENIQPADVHFTRFYAHMPSLSFLVAFDRKSIKDNETLKLKLNDMGLGLPKIELTFRKEDIEAIPDFDYTQFMTS